ncbi:MAG: hypothetical protein H0W88_02105 [Parachlamydiaceae bacterium]|nr:hypothetical protein [Parachlamydiaceae bacterium]
MTVVLHGPYEAEKNLISSLKLDDEETYTKDTWINLFKRAQKNFVPFLCIARTIVAGAKDTFICYHYEGVQFFKHIKITDNTDKAEMRDPLSQTPILKVNIFFIACFNLVKKNDLSPCKFEEVIKPSQQNIVNTKELLEIAFDALNVLAAEKDSNHEQIGRSQYILGHSIFGDDKLNGLRWLASSIKFGCPADDDSESDESPLSTSRRLDHKEEIEDTDPDSKPMKLDPIDDSLNAKIKVLEKAECKYDGSSLKIITSGAGSQGKKNISRIH